MNRDEYTEEEARARVRYAIERARKASRELTTVPGDEEFRKMLEARGIDYQEFRKFEEHQEKNRQWVGQMKENFGDRNKELNEFDPGKLNCRAELTQVGVTTWDPNIPVYKEDLEMISKAAPLADRILHKMQARHMEEVKKHNQEVRCSCGLEELPMGPDTTENIHEVVDDPEMKEFSPGMAERTDLEAGWYARGQQQADDWNDWNNKREEERQEMRNLFKDLKIENKENMEKGKQLMKQFAKDAGKVDIPVEELEKYAVKNAGDWDEWRREHQDVLQDEQPRVRHTIGYLEPEQTKMLQEAAFNYDTLLKKMQDTHARKNSDYGDAAYKGYKKYGDYYFLVQLNNKLSRLESLTIGDHVQQVMDESIDDTLMDMANYAIMYLESRHRHD